MGLPAILQDLPIPVEELLDTLTIPIRAEKCRRSFAFFVKEFWEDIDAEPLIWNWHIDIYCHELEKVAKRVFGLVRKDPEGNVIVRKRLPKEYDLLVNVPPGTSKSKIFTVMFPAWCWIWDATLKFINGSYSSDLSLEHADMSRDLIKCKRFRSYFPKIRIRPDKDAKGCYHNDSKGSRYSTSVGGTVTGMHAHFIIIDDPLNPKKAASEIELKSAVRWIDQTLSTRKIDKQVTVTILVMQRLHELDPSGKMLDKMKAGKKKVRHICLPGEIFEEKTRDLVRPSCLQLYYKDGMLDPIRMGANVLDELKADLGQYGYAGQIGQSPSPPGGGMFKSENIEIVPGIAATNIGETIRYWDKAGTENINACYTAGVKIARVLNHAKFKFIVLDVVRGQWEATEREQHIKQTAQLDGVGVTIWIEQEPGSGGKESAQSTVRNLAGFKVYAECPTGDKVTRADPFSVQVNWGNVCMLAGPWNYDYLVEMNGYPFGARKDQIDASAGAFNKLTLTAQAGVWGRK